VAILHSLIVEQGTFGNNPSAKDLAKHLFTRMYCGQTLVVADKPVIFLSQLRKDWLALERKVRRERSRTLDARRIYALTAMSSYMTSMRFSTDWPPNGYAVVHVYVVTLAQLLQWAPEAGCRTLYATTEISKEELYVVTSWMRKGGVIICLK
jgi:hypothetical protein